MAEAVVRVDLLELPGIKDALAHGIALMYAVEEYDPELVPEQIAQQAANMRAVIEEHFATVLEPRQR